MYKVIKAASNFESWKSIVEELEQESINHINSLDEDTHAGRIITELQQEVEKELGIWWNAPYLDYGSSGTIQFYNDDDLDDNVIALFNYSAFCSATTDLASQCNNEIEYKQKYREFLLNILNDSNSYVGSSSCIESSIDEYASFNVGDQFFDSNNNVIWEIKEVYHDGNIVVYVMNSDTGVINNHIDQYQLQNLFNSGTFKEV